MTLKRKRSTQPPASNLTNARNRPRAGFIALAARLRQHTLQHLHHDLLLRLRQLVEAHDLLLQLRRRSASARTKRSRADNTSTENAKLDTMDIREDPKAWFDQVEKTKASLLDTARAGAKAGLSCPGTSMSGPVPTTGADLITSAVGAAIIAAAGGE